MYSEENIKSVHSYINELGSSLDELERDDARMILNDLYLNGRDDYWICFALIRIMGKGSFSKWKYLLYYDDFIKENDYLYKDYVSMSITEKENLLSEIYAYCSDTDAFKNLSPEEEEELDFISNLFDCDEEYLNQYKDTIEYYYFKYCMSADGIKSILRITLYPTKREKEGTKKFEKWVRGLSVAEKHDLINRGWLKS